MKNYFYTLLFITAATFTSCGSDDDSSDDDGSTNLTNEISIDGDVSDITAGFVEEFGDGIRIGYFNNDFTLTGTIDDQQFFLYTELFSTEEANNVEFTGGTFTFDNDGISPPNFFFEEATFELDGGSEIFVTSGTVTVSGTSPDYVYEADLTLSDGTEIEVQYSGEFTLVNN